MRLLIVSHTPHYSQGDAVLGWGPTVREIDHLAMLFDEVVHVAPLHVQAPPAGALPYSSRCVVLRPVPPAGGSGLRAKLGILRTTPVWMRAIRDEMRRSDAIHVRCPANISLIGLLVLALHHSPHTRWIKYAGNWCSSSRESWSYTLQRWWLNRGFHRGVVTVNGRWPDQPKHVYSFLNPCLTDDELEQARRAAARKAFGRPVRLLFVGRLEAAKGVGRGLRVLASLVRRGVCAEMDLVGDGPERVQYEALAGALGLSQQVRFHGWLPRPALAPLYAQSHILLLPSSCSEGWPKVLSEGMAYGVVPIAGNVSSIPQYLEQFGTGGAFPPDAIDAFTEAIARYETHPALWKQESENGVRSADRFSYRRYVQAVQTLLEAPR